MAKTSPPRLLLIVTGSTLRAEEMDRPLGYYLKQRIEAALAGSDSEAATKHDPDLSDYQVRVIADFRWIHDEFLQGLPTDLPGGTRSQCPGAPLARRGPHFPGLQRALLHPDGS